MPSVLDKIVETKRRELESQRAILPQADLAGAARDASPPRDFFNAVTRPGDIRLIAEIKKASPSAGVIVEQFDPPSIAHAYYHAGASALSVLTDQTHFQGRLEYVSQVRKVCPLPVLRKDFTLDEYHVYQARAAGADAVLLIAEVLPPSRIDELAGLAGELGMTALIETHDPDLLLSVAERVKRLRGPVLLGINNRNLAIQQTDIRTTVRLAPLVKGVVPVVSESGIKTRADVLAVRKAGVAAILVGESILRARDMGAHIAHLLGVTS
ncbi:MAG: indole-3-glycerol phosphate synthase TrpC [Phycisphaerae bacterium]|nr:indole-3-glycerol phosphate synthase TrpC [Phycisphaerae bacterium]